MEEATPVDHVSSGHAGQSGSSKAQPPSCLASIPSFISFEPAPLGSSFCPHVAQCPNIYNSPWQVRGWREESVNTPPPSPHHTQSSGRPGPCTGLPRPMSHPHARQALVLSSLEHLGHSQQQHHRPFEGRENQLTDTHQAPAMGRTQNVLTNQKRPRPPRRGQFSKNVAESQELVYRGWAPCGEPPSLLEGEPASHLGTSLGHGGQRLPNSSRGL